jgi:sigma-B regulation protein RsbU (phosphoserine phosphatase)
MQPLTVPGSLDSLSKIGNYIKLATAEAGLERSRVYKLRLAVDEIATNIINYGYGQAGIQGEITISADLDDNALTITLDDTAGYFDPTLKPPPPPEDFSKPLEERGIGGWGVYLALQSVDQFHYHRIQNHNQNVFVMYRATHGDLLLIGSSNQESNSLVDYLVELGYSVTLVEDSGTAQKHLKNHITEMILLEIPIKGQNTVEFIKALKADNALRSIPVIILTELDHLDEAEICVSSGAEDYIVLPYSPVVLKARLSVNLERHRVRISENNLRDLHNNDRDVQIGQQIQRSFFPEFLPQVPGWEIGACFDPARQVAGDFYDSFSLSDEYISLIIGDVCDKGINAALYMTLFRSLLRAYSQEEYTPESPSKLIENSLQKTNDYIRKNHGTSNMFSTIFFGILQPSSGDLYYVNAGHESPLILNSSGVKDVLKPSGLAVGMMAETEYKVLRTRLDSGDTLMIFTDGLLGAKDSSGQVFGRERLMDIFSSTDLSPSALLNNIALKLHSFISDGPLLDDITMLAVKRK